MAVTAEEARGLVLDGIGMAVDRISIASASLSEAYEVLDDATADRLEETLFRQVQRAFGKAKRTEASYAERNGMAKRSIEPLADSGGGDAKALIAQAVEACEEADRFISSLQDDPLTLEAGDPELRAGLAEVRELLGGLSVAARDMVRGLGR